MKLIRCGNLNVHCKIFQSILSTSNGKQIFADFIIYLHTKQKEIISGKNNTFQNYNLKIQRVRVQFINEGR